MSPYANSTTRRLAWSRGLLNVTINAPNCVSRPLIDFKSKIVHVNKLKMSFFLAQGRGLLLCSVWTLTRPRKSNDYMLKLKIPFSYLFA